MKIVLATDGSTGSTIAATFITANLMPDLDAPVEVVTVTEWPAHDDAWEVSEHVGASLPPEESPLRAATNVLREHAFPTTGTVLSGRADTAIAGFARSVEAGLVVVGSRGLHGWRRAIAGSISSSVAHASSVPVLVAGAPGRVSRVVVGYDGSEAARAALEVAAGLPLAGAPEWVVCVAYEAAPPLASGIAPTMMVAMEEAYAADLAVAKATAEAAAREALGMLAAHGIAALTALGHGTAPDVLLDVAGHAVPTLLVVGDRGRSPLRRLVLGSTSSALLGAGHVDVLIAHGPPPGPLPEH